MWKMSKCKLRVVLSVSKCVTLLVDCFSWASWSKGIEEWLTCWVDDEGSQDECNKLSWGIGQVDVNLWGEKEISEVGFVEEKNWM